MLVGLSAAMPFRCAAAARRTIPGPKSTRYGWPLTMMAVAGPERSGVGPGLPVPRRTTWVRDGAALCVLASPATAIVATMTTARDIAVCIRSLLRLLDPSVCAYTARGE